jgi:hypothetical protein
MANAGVCPISLEPLLAWDEDREIEQELAAQPQPKLKPSSGHGIVRAVQQVRRMRGGAQAHLMRCSDEEFYVVKFQNNPQHPRVLANEYLASRLAQLVGLPVPEPRIVEVDKWLIENTPDLTILLAGRCIPCHAGLSFGSRYVLDPTNEHCQVFDFLPETMFGKIKEVGRFAGMLAFDKWTANADGRQCAFYRRAHQRKYQVAFIDHGYCFNAGEWTFVDSPLRGVYARNVVYEGVTGWRSFEPWLSRIEGLESQEIFAICDEIPVEWYGDWDDLARLAEQLYQRRTDARKLISDFRESSRSPFPNWR